MSGCTVCEAGKRRTRLPGEGLLREGARAAARGPRRRIDFLTPVPNGDDGIVPAAQGTEVLDRAPLHLVQDEG